MSRLSAWLFGLYPEDIAMPALLVAVVFLASALIDIGTSGGLLSYTGVSLPGLAVHAACFVVLVLILWRIPPTSSKVKQWALGAAALVVSTGSLLAVIEIQDRKRDQPYVAGEFQVLDEMIVQLAASLSAERGRNSNKDLCAGEGKSLADTVAQGSYRDVAEAALRLGACIDGAASARAIQMLKAQPDAANSENDHE